MIVMARVDDRLIHGQVAVKWCKQLNITRIIVASDAIAKNAVQVSALKMAAPAGVKAAVLPISKAVAILNDPRSKDLRILLVSNDPADLLGVFQGISERPTLDVANYGRINSPISGKKKISDSVYLTESDIEAIKSIHDLGVEVITQPVPTDDRKDVMGLL
mgnify:FL=1|jgi:PTS system mannose-specific IIB component